MRIGVLGTGMVGQALGTALAARGHGVRMGAREGGNEVGAAWAAAAEGDVAAGTFAEAAGFGEVVLNCTAGTASLAALRASRPEQLVGKILVDVANPLDFSHGMPPTLTVCNTDSLGEQLQRELPATRVVKALNTVTAAVMVDPSRIPGEHHLPICGDDPAAKAEVTALLGELGWPEEAILDLGDITASRATEMYLPLWLRLWGTLGTPDVSLRVVRAPAG